MTQTGRALVTLRGLNKYEASNLSSSLTPSDIFGGDEFETTSPYGPRIHPTTKKHQHHNGLDFKTPVGTGITAPSGGVVEKIGSDNKSGNFIVFRFGENGRSSDGYYMSFSHLDKVHPDIKEGSTVQNGTPLGWTGKTGRVSGPHLHLVVKDTKNNTIDPAGFFEREKREA